MNITVPTFEFVPLHSFGPAVLGASRAEIRTAFLRAGFPLEDSLGSSDYFCDASIQVEYSPSERANFIGVSSSPRFAAHIYGLDVFDIDASELFAIITSHDNSGAHMFDEYEYLFPNQLVSLWDADQQYDRKGNERRVIWAQVGIRGT
jgi:hypothetical protein